MNYHKMQKELPLPVIVNFPEEEKVQKIQNLPKFRKFFLVIMGIFFCIGSLILIMSQVWTPTLKYEPKPSEGAALGPESLMVKNNSLLLGRFDPAKPFKPTYKMRRENKIERLTGSRISNSIKMLE